MRLGIGIGISLFVCQALVTASQHTVTVRVLTDGRPVADATIIVGTVGSVADHTAHTDNEGKTVLSLGVGTFTIVARKDGLLTSARSVTVDAGAVLVVTFELAPQPTVSEEVTVAATRTGGRVEDQPLRVEVLEREEIEEKMLMTPGDIVMMLNEMGGMRVQTTAPSLGAASVRVQGMQGRYTRFLSDGLPLFGEVGGLGLLQIPPMDLGRVEVIKGVASSLYGSGAMGGVVNLISREPGASTERELLLNRSTRGATDIVGFLSAPVSEQWGLTLLGSVHGQSWTDVDGDGWSDLPRYRRAVVRPRVFWNDGQGNRFFGTIGMTIEDRAGGTRPHVALPVAGVPYVEGLDTTRLDAGLLDQRLVKGSVVITSRAAVSWLRHTHQFGERQERDRHTVGFGEVTARGASGVHTWVVGTALEIERYRNRDVSRFDHADLIPGLFVQDDVVVSPWLSVSGSLRLDHHSEYGTFLSPRLGVLLRGRDWNSRLSVGTGFFGPSALTEETEAAGLSRLTVTRPLQAERGRNLSLDFTRTVGPVSATTTLFVSRVRYPLEVRRDTEYVLGNAAEPTTTSGAELIGTFRQEPFSVTATYTYVRSREGAPSARRQVALTPTHSAGLVGMWEREDLGRVGLELYATGAQRLEANPFRSRSEPYVIVGLLVERQVGRLRLFVNGENLTGVRQSTWHPLLREERAADGHWTVDAWAPLDGRNINGGLRIIF